MSNTPAKPRIVIGSDHAGFSVKEIIRKYLEGAGYAVSDVLALGDRMVTGEAAIEMVQVFLSTAYLGGRHQRRLDKITAIEKAERATARGSS